MRTTFRFFSALLSLLAFVGAASAQTFPSRPIKLVVPTTAGSPTDVLARLTAQHLSTALKQGVVVDNRPGGGGTIGTKAVAAAPADGYTLLFTEGAKHLMTPALYKNPGYDPVKDFAPVSIIGGGAFVMVTAPSVPARSVQEYAAHARANPGKLAFGFGQGTIPHMLGESFKLASGADITSVPYKGGAQAITDMLGGRIHLNFGTTATLLPLIREGKLVALAVTSERRSPDLPNVPTMTESGYPALSLIFWMGLWAPPDTPADVVARLNAASNEIVALPEMREAMAKLGFDPRTGSPQQIASFIAAESPKWIEIAKQSGVQGD